MELPLRCPDESYDITAFICRARQSKAYAKCPACPNRGRVQDEAPAPVPGLTAPMAFAAAEPAYGRELDAAEVPAEAPVPAAAQRLRRMVQAKAGGVAAMAAASGAALQARGHAAGDPWHFLRRVYEFF